MINLKNENSLLDIAYREKENYQKSFPFPHIYLDNFFDEKYLDLVVDEFPDLSLLNDVIKHSGSTDEKLASPRGDKYQKKYTKKLLSFLNGSEFLDFLKILCSINEHLIPDPHFIGGGFHETKNGGFLKVHADFCKHPENNLDRRVNVLIFLNKNWEKAYKGELMLFDKEMKKFKSLLPIFNRVVIFNTTDFTYHGVPDPLLTPKGITRKSLALYYFSNGRPKEEIRLNNTNNSTIYKKRDGENFKFDIKKFALELTPPILFKFIKKLRKKTN